MKGMLIQDEIPTPDKPVEIKYGMVDKNADEYITKLEREIERYKLIIKALEKHFTDLEYYEDNEFLRQLLSVTDNDMIWLKRMAGEENKQ